MMPRPLQIAMWVIFFEVETFICLVLVPFALSLAVAHGEPTFTRDQRAQLVEEYPGGTFIDDRTYKWCAGQQWWLIDARGNNSPLVGSCIRWK